MSLCPHWQDNPVQRLLFFFDFSPLAVMAWITAVSLISWDTFALGLSLVVYADWGMNLFFNFAIVRQEGPQGAHCIYTQYQNPAYNVEQVAVIFTMYVCLGALYRTWRIPFHTVLLVCLNTSLLIVNHIYRRVNTVEAVVTGGLLGMADGFLGFLFLYVAVPYMARCLDYLPWARGMGLRNYYFRPHATPEKVLEAREHASEAASWFDRDGTDTDWVRLCFAIWTSQLRNEMDSQTAKRSRLSLLAADVRSNLVLTEEEEEFCELMAQSVRTNHLRSAVDQLMNDCARVMDDLNLPQHSHPHLPPLHDHELVTT